MVRGATQTFRISFVSKLDTSMVKSWCLAFGISNTRCILSIESELADRGHFEVSPDTGTKTFVVTITEEESLKLKAGTLRVQLKLGLSDGSVVISHMTDLTVENVLCDKPIAVKEA